MSPYATLAAMGYSPVPINPHTKRPPTKADHGYPHGVAWSKLQESPADSATLCEWESWGAWCGVVTGYNGLEAIDFDVPGKASGATGDPPAYEPWRRLLAENGHAELLGRLAVVQTPSGGRHVYYRCPAPEGNQKLAMTSDGADVLIETRGRGGLVVCPPSPGYKLLSGSMRDLEALSQDERDTLIRAARLLDERIEEDPHAKAQVAQLNGKGRPGDDFNSRATWDEILTPHGWVPSGRWNGQMLWRRPGKRDGWSAKTGDNGRGDYMVVWSSNAGLPQGKGLTKFAVHALLNCRGDFSAAAKELGERGFGAPPSAPSAPAAPQGPDGDGPPFRATDLGNAERLVRLHGQDLRYCHLWGRWLVWDGRCWQEDATGEAPVRRLAHSVVRGILDEALTVADPDRRAEMAKWAVKCEERRKLEAIVALAKSLDGVPVTPSEMDRDPWLLCVRNGTIDLRTGELLPHRREDLITRCVDIDYRPDARAELFEQVVYRAMDGKAELCDFLHRWLGSNLAGVNRDQVFAFFYGPQGNNGKSTIVEIVMRVLGTGYAKTCPTETLMAKTMDGGISNDLARLKGARMVVAPETEDGKRLNEGLLKRLSGGDTITARYLHQEFFEFRPSFKITIVGNHRPEIRGTDDAIWRRVRLVPFDVVVPPEERDSELPEKLWAEREGILAFLVAGCLRWRADGLGNPEGIAKATDSYRSESDILGAFLEECIEQGVGREVRASKIYGAYQDWCKRTNEYCATQTRFGKAMGERGFVSRKTRTGWVYEGVSVIEEGLDDVYRG